MRIESWDLWQFLIDLLWIIILPQNDTDHTHLANLQSRVILITSSLRAWTSAAACWWSKSLFRVQCSREIRDQLRKLSPYHSLFHSPQPLSQMFTALYTRSSLPPPFLTGGLCPAPYVSATKWELILLLMHVYPSHRGLLLLFLKSVVPKNHPCHLLNLHTRYLMLHEILYILPP